MSDHSPSCTASHCPGCCKKCGYWDCNRQCDYEDLEGKLASLSAENSRLRAALKKATAVLTLIGTSAKGGTPGWEREFAASMLAHISPNPAPGIAATTPPKAEE